MQPFHPCPPIRISPPKKVVASLLGVASGALRVVQSAVPRSAAPAVVIVEPFGMGDAISLLPLVGLLLDRGHRVVVCARPPWRLFFPPEVEWVDCVVPWASYGDGEKYRFKALFGPLFRQFLVNLRRAAAGHIGLDTRGDARSTLLLRLAGCHPVYSLDRYLGSDLHTARAAARLVPLDPGLRRWQVNLQFAHLLGCPPGATGRPHLARTVPPVPADQGRRTLGLIPVTPWPGRAWPASAWRGLIKSLRDAGETLRVLGGPGQETIIREAVGDDVPITVCTSIPHWMEQLSALEAVVAIDSGPTHLADALDVPLVALYGSGQLPLWAPSGPRSLVLHRQDDPDYQPIHPVDANIARGLELMARHQVGDVLQALAEVRKRPSRSPAPDSGAIPSDDRARV